MPSDRPVTAGPSPSDGLFGAVYARGPAAAATSDRAWLQAMLDVEAALARASARLGLIPPAAAEAIVGACRVDAFDLASLVRETGDHATPVVPLVRSLRAALAADVAPHAHRGATSQDVVDTAAMLVLRRAAVPLLADARAAADGAALLSDAHRDTPITGRTLLQAAVPTSFGLKAAGWLCAIDEAVAGIAGAGDALAVQLGGPVGHGAPRLATAVARELGLAEPIMPWHTNRVRPAAFACALGTLAGTLAKVARDVTLLAQTEVAEVREGGAPRRGRSSTMAHKRNPVAAVSVLACAQRAPGLVATMLAAMAHSTSARPGRGRPSGAR